MYPVLYRTYQMVLAYVLTGKSKDYGPGKADDFKNAPEGFDSVCGTEMNQKVYPVQKAARANDRLASALLRFGHIYGRQFALFQSDNIYPAYIVRYRMNPAEAQMHRADVVCTAKTARFVVKGQIVWQREGLGIAFVVLSSTSLEVKGKWEFNPWSRDRGDRDAAQVCECIAKKIAPEDIVLIAVTWFV